jgi:predicted  nucleic acid-binding Zn-ribbon protein
MENQEIYILKAIQEAVVVNGKESLIFHAEMRQNLTQVLNDLKDLEKRLIENEKEVHAIKEGYKTYKEDSEKIHTKFNWIYGALTLIGFFII